MQKLYVGLAFVGDSVSLTRAISFKSKYFTDMAKLAKLIF